MAETGHISIHTENILPIIKKWLYSEKQIYLRELVANATDAMTKLSKLAMMGEVTTEVAEPKISISIDKDAGTLTVTDTGLGLTADEMKKYINQVAFSGVKDFVEKYQDKADDDQVIGHFGLGFYSTFMVADKVEIDSLSYQEDAEAAHWVSSGSTEFTISPSQRTAIGTSITLHISEDSKEMLEAGTIRGILDKYCSFIRYPIELEGNVVNDSQPIWTKSPSALEEKDYKEFFQKLFPLAPEPLFWIHLNVDYPFKLRGVLYFPKLKHELDASQGEVKLYCNQVYVADNPKELVPEFLTLLKGVVDCPDLPLNVSRSFLQNEPQVVKIRQHITKKVADRLTGMAKTEKEEYEKYWEDIHTFVKFGMMRDEKFYERMSEFLIFKSSNGGFTTLDEYLERMKEKTDSKIIYASDATMQSSYLAMLQEHELEAIIADTMIDQHFLPYVEMQSSKKFQFQRIDAEVLTGLKNDASSQIVDPKDNKTQAQRIEEIFTSNLTIEKLKVKVESLKSENLAGMLLLDENARRMQEMSKLGGIMGQLGGMPEVEQTLLINENSTAVKNLLRMTQGLAPDPKKVKMIAEHIYDLAFMQHNNFSADGMKAFIERSVKILSGFDHNETQEAAPPVETKSAAEQPAAH